MMLMPGGQKSCIRKSYIRKFPDHFWTSTRELKSLKNWSSYVHTFFKRYQGVLHLIQVINIGAIWVPEIEPSNL